MLSKFIVVLMFIIVPPLAGAIFNFSLLRAMFSDLRFPRILHYVILSLLGAILFITTCEIGEADILILYKLPVFFICLTYAAIFAIVTNNIEDLEADKISNPDRPLVKNAVTVREYLMTGVICQLIALIIAFLADINMFYGVLAISLGYFIYSCKPFRLKRIPFLSKFIIGLNSLAVAVTGFVLSGGDLADFPVMWAIYILVPLSLSANFIDLKDIEGDRATGIKTLPVILGEVNAKRLIAFFTLSSYAMAAILLNVYWMYLLIIPTAALHVFLLLRQPYREKPVFFVYLLAIFALNVLLLLR